MSIAATAIICQLATQSVTMSYMDGRPSVLVRRCEYHCTDNVKKTHQIYYDDTCPNAIYKRTKSLYSYPRRR